MKRGDNARYNLTRETGVGGGSIPNAKTVMHELDISGNLLTGIEIWWPDAVSAATITIEGTNFSTKEVDGQAGATDPAVVTADTRWITYPITVAGPTAAAAGGTLVDIGGLGTLRLRLKIVTTAITRLFVRGNAKD